MNLQDIAIKTKLGTNDRVKYLTKLMRGNRKRKPMGAIKAGATLDLMCLLASQRSLCIEDNFETLYNSVFTTANAN